MRHNPDFDHEPGMSLRDYFIAHAPAEPQPWFSPSLPARPVRPTRPRNQDLTPPAVDELAGLGDWLDTKDITDPKARTYAEALEQYNQDHSAWEMLRTSERYLQWPGAWADEMIKRRGAA